MKNKSLNWYVKIGAHTYGPYHYKTLIKMLQTNQLMDFNYVKNEQLTDWTPIYRVEQFSQKKLKSLLKKEAHYESFFIKRQGERAQVEIPVTGHNSLKFFEGEIVSISESGALCFLNSENLMVGEKIKLHLNSHLNIEGEIIRKNYSKQGANSREGLFYAVKFTEVHESGLEQIKKWVSAS